MNMEPFTSITGFNYSKLFSHLILLINWIFYSVEFKLYKVVSPVCEVLHQNQAQVTFFWKWDSFVIFYSVKSGF